MKDSKRRANVAERGQRMTRAEAAAYLRVKPATLAAWASLGTVSLPYHRVGQRAFYFQSDLDALIESGRIVPAEVA